jgi:hypothetical protein
VRRREFITLLGGAAAWPVAARAQQASKIAKVGVLYPGTAATLPSRLAGLREGLQAAGYREPDNIELVARAAEGDPKRIAPLAMELAERKVDVMVPVSPAAIDAALAASTTIPIVALDFESDPIARGWIKSLSRPGGQVTGIECKFAALLMSAPVKVFGCRLLTDGAARMGGRRRKTLQTRHQIASTPRRSARRGLLLPRTVDQIPAEKDGNLRVVYARIGRCQGRPAWRGAQAAVARPYPAVTCHVGVNGGRAPLPVRAPLRR